MRIKVFFRTDSGLSEIKKIYTVGDSVHIKRVVSGAEEVREFDFSHLQNGKAWQGGRTDTIYRVERTDDGDLFVNVAGYGTFDDIDVSSDDSPFYAYLADGETETQDTVTETHSDVPVARSSAEVKTDKIAAWKRRIGGAAESFSIADISEADRNTDAWRNTLAFFRSWVGVVWYEIDLCASGDAYCLTDTQIESLIVLCEEQLAIGAKKFYYENNVDATSQAWKAKFDAYEIWTAGDDFLPANNWYSDQDIDALGQSVWTTLINDMYPKAQAYSVGVEL